MLRIVGDGEEELSAREVDTILVGLGVRPDLLREFAWELVCQDIAGGLPRAYTLRLRALASRFRRLIAMVKEAGVDDDLLISVLDGLAVQPVNRAHKGRAPGHHRNLDAS